MRSRLILLFISIFFGVIILEAGLRWFTVFPVISWVDSPNLTKDEILSFTLAYNKFYGIDHNGFRNPQTLKNAEIATLGDSHTFGFNVKTEYSWPYQLSRMTNKPVYNFGIGHYGIVQYYYLMDKAVKLNPRNIIIGLYLANDLNDTCLLLKKLDYWRKWAQENNVKIEDCNCPACVEDEPGGSIAGKTTISSFPGYLKSAIKKTAIVTFIDYMIWTPLKAELFYLMNEDSPPQRRRGIIR